jgi:hypothetical protein
MQNLHQSAWDHDILYADRPSKDERLLVDLFCEKIVNVEGGWDLKFMFGVVEKTQEPLHL